MISGLLMISYFSIFGLHASEKIVKYTDRYITAPLPDRYECELKWINENTLGQFRNNQPEIITCVYKCQDANGRFDWIDWAKEGYQQCFQQSYENKFHLRMLHYPLHFH